MATLALAGAAATDTEVGDGGLEKAEVIEHARRMATRGIHRAGMRSVDSTDAQRTTWRDYLETRPGHATGGAISGGRQVWVVTLNGDAHVSLPPGDLDNTDPADGTRTSSSMRLVIDAFSGGLIQVMAPSE